MWQSLYIKRILASVWVPCTLSRADRRGVWCKPARQWDGHSPSLGSYQQPSWDYPLLHQQGSSCWCSWGWTSGDTSALGNQVRHRKFGLYEETCTLIVCHIINRMVGSLGLRNEHSSFVKDRNILTSWENGSLSRRILIHGVSYYRPYVLWNALYEVIWHFYIRLDATVICFALFSHNHEVSTVTNVTLIKSPASSLGAFLYLL